MRARVAAASVLIWSLAVCIQLTVPMKNIYLMYVIAAVVQILVLLWFLLLRKKAAGRPVKS
jgi:hypothetical protein